MKIECFITLHPLNNYPAQLKEHTNKKQTILELQADQGAGLMPDSIAMRVSLCGISGVVFKEVFTSPCDRYWSSKGLRSSSDSSAPGDSLSMCFFSSQCFNTSLPHKLKVQFAVYVVSLPLSQSIRYILILYFGHCIIFV